MAQFFAKSMIQKCDKECFRKNKQNDPEINSTFHLLGGIYTGCTTIKIAQTHSHTGQFK